MDRNATQAAIRAGYSKRSARQVAARMLSNDDIQSAIQVKCREAEKRLQITRDDILRGLLAAYQMAKAKENPTAMVSAMREVAKLMGYYRNPPKEQLPVGDRERFLRQLQTMPERKLLKLASKG